MTCPWCFVEDYLKVDRAVPTGAGGRVGDVVLTTDMPALRSSFDSKSFARLPEY